MNSLTVRWIECLYYWLSHFYYQPVLSETRIVTGYKRVLFLLETLCTFTPWSGPRFESQTTNDIKP